MLDATVVIPTLGQISDEFQAGSEVSLVVSVYLVVSAVMMPVWGRLLDVRGERTAYTAALAFFFVGTLVALTAPSLPVLILARILQGIGGGGLSPLGQAVLAGRCTPAQRARLQIWYTLFYAVFAGFGPMLGSVALASGSWRTSFAIVLVMITIPTILLWGQLRTAGVKGDRKFDKRGALALCVGLLLIVVGIQVASPRPGWQTALALTVGVGVLMWFYRHASRLADPVLSITLIKTRLIGVCSMAALANGFTIFGFMTYLPLIALSRGSSTWFAGLVVLPLTAGWTVLSAASARISLRTGNRILLVAGGGLAILAGALVFTSNGASPQMSQVALLGASTAAGLSAGLIAVPNMLLAQRHAPAHQIGSVTALIMFMRNFGGTLAVALVAAVAVILAPELDDGASQTFWIMSVVGGLIILLAFRLPSRASELRDLAKQ